MSQSSLSFVDAFSADALLVRDVDGQYRPAGSDEVLQQARKTLAWINAQAGTKVQGYGLRATFASIAEELVSGGVLKRMMNHAAGGDVTLGHYETQLRGGWQKVADFVDAAATAATSARTDAYSHETVDHQRASASGAKAASISAPGLVLKCAAEGFSSMGLEDDAT